MKSKFFPMVEAIALLGCLAPYAEAQNYTVVNVPYAPQATSISPPALPADAREITSRYEVEKAEIRKNARKQVSELRMQLLEKLRELQNRYTRDAKLDEAVAVRDHVRALKQSSMRAIPNPGSLSNYYQLVGRTFFFRVTSSNQGPVWGVDAYTADSNLATAAVHAGVLKMGQTGVVKVTILPGQASYQGSTRNGIASSSWSSFSASYKVEPIGEEDEDADEASAVPPVSPPPAMQQGYYRGSSETNYPYYTSGNRIEMSPMYSGTSYYFSSPGQVREMNAAMVPVIHGTPAEPTPSAELPQDARQLVDRFQTESAAIHKAANRKITASRRRALVELMPLQDNYTREAKLDEAVAIRDTIRALREPVENVLPDPGNVYAQANKIGNVLYYRVTGARVGALWGTNVYTADSTLAAAAIHSGVLKEGQTGIVKVTILRGLPAYQGMTRNGVSSYAFGTFPFSYKVETAEDDDAANPFEESPDKPARPAAAAPNDETPAGQLKELRQEFSRLHRQLRETTAQLKQLREEVQNLKKTTTPEQIENH